MNEILYKLAFGMISIIVIVGSLIFWFYPRIKENSEKTFIQYFGDVYFRICITTFASMGILCENIYEFIAFQICNMFAAALISQYIIKINTKDK